MEAEPLKTFDPSLNELRDILKKFSGIAVDVLHDKHLSGPVETIQKAAPSLPPTIKIISKLLVEVGDKAAKPIFQRFSEQKQQVIDPALQKIFNLLIKEDYSALREQLTIHLQTVLEKKLPSKGKLPSDYIKPIVQWATSPDAQKGLFPANMVIKQDLDMNLVGKLANEAAEFCKNHLSNEHKSVYTYLERAITHDLKDAKIYRKQEFNKDYVQPVLDWLLLSDHLTPINNSFKPIENYREDLIDKVFELAISLLVERKIDQYALILEKTLQNNLETIVHKTVRVNAGLITDFFTGRLSELITAMPYSETFNTLFHKTIPQQIEGYIAAEKILDTHIALIRKAKQGVEIVPKNEEEKKIKESAEAHLAAIGQHGGEKQFLQHILTEEFSKQSGCSLRVQQIIQQEIALTLQGKDPANARKASEKAIYTSIAENFLTLMLPIKKKVTDEGLVIEVDPFVELWNGLFLPKEFHDLVHHVEELASELITPTTVEIFGRVKQPLLELAMTIFRSLAQETLKKHLINLIELAFEKITVPENLNELAAETILPAVNRQLVKLFISQELGLNIKKVAPFFLELLKQGSTEHKANSEKITKLAVQLAKDKFKNFDGTQFYSNEIDEAKIEFKDLSDAEWKELALPTIMDIETYLLKHNDGHNDLAAITLKIDRYYQESYVGNDPAFGTLAMNLIFKIGRLPNEGIISLFIRDSISKALTSGTTSLRSSHPFLVECISDGLKTTLLDPNYVKAILSDEPVKKPSKTPQKLTHQINITSRIAYDYIMRLSESQGMITKQATKFVLTDKPSEVHQVVTRIYRKLFGNQLLNQNLILESLQELFIAFAQGADRIRNEENLLVHQKIASLS